MNKTDKTSGGKAKSALATPTDLSENGVKSIAASLNGLAADAFALYVKTKNFHWHMSGPHFRDYHLLLDEQGTQIFEMIDPLARTRAQARADDAALDRPYRQAAVDQGRRPAVRRAAGDAERAELETTGRSPPRCAKRTSFATTMATSRRRAFSKSGSTKPNGGPGSCSKRPAAPTTAGTERGATRISCRNRSPRRPCRIAQRAGLARRAQGFQEQSSDGLGACVSLPVFSPRGRRARKIPQEQLGQPIVGRVVQVDRIETKFVGQTPVAAPCKGGREIDESGMIWQGGTPEFAVHLGHFSAQGLVPDRQPQEFGAPGWDYRRQPHISAGCGSLFSQPKQGLGRLTNDGATGRVIQKCRRDEIISAALNDNDVRLQCDGVTLKATRHLS